MRTLRTWVRVVAFGSGALWIAACGGTGTNPITSEASADGASGDGASGEGGKGSRDGSSSDAKPGKDASGTDTGGGGDSPACPDEHGHYTVKSAGMGCGNALTDSAPQCIVQTGCTIQLQSMPASGGTALNTTTSIPIAGDGSFMDGTIYEGDGTMGTPRSGCTGAWDAKTSTLTINCGGMIGSSQSCIVTLEYSSASCS
jgi:hypothetical protein